MTHKISMHLDDSLGAPDRRTAAAEMDRIRASLRASFSVEDILDMKREGYRSTGYFNSLFNPKPTT